MLPDWYSTQFNAESHPLRIAYERFDTDMKSALATMKANQSMYDIYIQAQQRLQRLTVEQQDLLSIMASDLTSDILVNRLKGEQ